MRKLVLAALVGAMTCGSAQAAILITVRQVGANVVFTQTGSINLGSFTYAFTQGSVSPSILPDVFRVFNGSTSPSDFYNGAPASGPSNFGTGTQTNASSGTGNLFAVNGSSGIGVPVAYVSGTALTGTATYNNATFGTLGITPGNYVLNYGSGATADSITLNAGAPEPAAWALMILGFGAIGAMLRRTRRPYRRAIA